MMGTLFYNETISILEIPAAPQVRNIVDRSGDKVVDPDDPMPAGEQQVGQVRAQKAGGTGDDGGGLRAFHR